MIKVKDFRLLNYMIPYALHTFKAAERLEVGDYISVNEEGRIVKAVSVATTDGIAMKKASRRGALVQVLVGVFANDYKNISSRAYSCTFGSITSKASTT